MLYHAYEMTHAAIKPMRAAARLSQEVFRNPLNPMAGHYGSRAVSAALEMFINATQRYGKPEWEIGATFVDGFKAPVEIDTVWTRPFCNLLHFRRLGEAENRDDPPVLVIAPMSGHYATLLRGTVRSMLPEHNVYVTDWTDARDVPLTEGRFDLDDYTDYIIEMCDFLAAKTGERPAILAVCQPGIPAMAAASLMAMDGHPARPSSLTLMGSPIDTARNPQQPNEFAQRHSLKWFEQNVVVRVPWPNRGFMRQVYPGFLQLSGFMAMNVDRHLDAHVNQFNNLVRGDGESAEGHRRFYDEYLAVMDLTAEYYLQTVDRVFKRRLIAQNQYRYRDRLVEPAAITDIALFTVEGAEDDITGLGQTEAAQDLLTGLPKSERMHYTQKEVGHYGVFNGSRWRQSIQPRVRDFIHGKRRTVS